MDKKVLQTINYWSISGNLIDSTDPNRLDYTLRFRTHYDTCQKEIATTSKKIKKTYRVSQNYIPNQLSGDTFDVVQYLATDLTYSATGSKAYSFKVDNVSTIYIEEETAEDTWTTLSTISHTTPVGYFTEYTGLITASDTDNDIRIRFSGSYPYNIRDIALFAYSFPSAGTIPQYQRYRLYNMPSDFFQLNKIIFKGNPSDGYSYNPTADFYWEKRNVLAINYFNVGEYTIDYNAYPTDIDDNTLTTYEFEIDVEAQEAIPFYVASHMMLDENGNINNKLYTMYQGKLANLDDKVSNGATSISNTLFTSTTNKLF
jgi:hypothetical protein